MERDGPGGRRKERQVNDSSTDSVELVALRESSATQAYEPTTSQSLRQDQAPAELEANVILISHPENRMLGTRFRLRPGSVIEIGRASASEISLPEVLAVSRHHARLEHRGAEVVLEDLGSTNGTFVNDRQITGETALASGDRFNVGSVHFKFLRERDVETAYHLAIYNLVSRDGLTEIYNQRKFAEEAERETVRAIRYQRPLTLLLFDIDHFKAINDNCGHLCGDFVLKHLSQRVSELVRAEQVFARVGGEEFVVLCPETEADQGMILAERLREQIASEAMEYSGFQVPVTCSFGVAQLLPEMADAEALFAAADRALYHSKQEGRDRVTLYRPDLHGRPPAG